MSQGLPDDPPGIVSVWVRYFYQVLSVCVCVYVCMCVCVPGIVSVCVCVCVYQVLSVLGSFLISDQKSAVLGWPRLATPTES